jgi:hypothetical protein
VAVFCFIAFVVFISPAEPRSKPPFQMSRSEHLNMYQRYAITWTLPFPSWGDPLSAEMRPALYRLLEQELQAHLTSPNGWQRAGIRFVYTPSVANANIVFYADKNAQVFSDCDDENSVACEEFTSSGHCNIRLGYGVNSVKRITWHFYSPETGTVNHEIGHCFGFNHTAHGLMEIDSPVEYPSAQLIRFVQHEINNSNEAFGNGRATEGGK